jgi:type I restriction enzyme S subunit
MALCDRLEAARRTREATRDRLTAASLARLNASDPETFHDDAGFALDALPALTARADQIKHLRQTILNLAVCGKLVPQDANDEPASELLKRIAETRAASGKRQKELPEINADELGELPPGWYAAPLIALGDWAIGSGFPKNEQGEADGPYFFLKVSDMNLPGNEKFITVANNFIDDAAAKRMRAAIHPPGTIIFPKIGGAIATNKRRILTRRSAIDNNCLGITFSSNIDTEWAYLLMTTLDFTRYQAGTAVPALQQGTLASIPVAVPPLAEQRRIVAKVDELMALCDRLEASLATANETRRRLLEALLAEALASGEARELEAAE